MIAYSTFTAKRGRPRVDRGNHKTIMQSRMNRSLEENVICSLLYLSKINAEQYLSVQFYQKLYHCYNKSIEAPSNNSCSVTKINDKYCQTKHLPSKKDEEVLQKWVRVKAKLSEVSGDCQELVNKVVIENKMKYELLNPTSISRNLMGILASGLDKITEYRSENACFKKSFYSKIY